MMSDSSESGLEQIESVGYGQLVWLAIPSQVQRVLTHDNQCHMPHYIALYYYAFYLHYFCEYKIHDCDNAHVFSYSCSARATVVEPVNHLHPSYI